MGNFHARRGLGLMTAAWAKPGGELPLYSGVELIGSSVMNTEGILSGFTSSSYALLPFDFPANTKYLDVCCKFRFDNTDNSGSGIIGGLGNTNIMSPFYYLGSNNYRWLSFYISFDGVQWNFKWPEYRLIQIEKNIDYILKMTFDAESYTWTEIRPEKRTLLQIQSDRSINGGNGLRLQMGTNRGINNPLTGVIDLNYCYIKTDDCLLWEGVVGAHKNIQLLI